jgi:hypothetical protein
MTNFIKFYLLPYCPLPFAPCSLPFALCSLPFALCLLLFALCPLLFTSCGNQDVKLNGNDRVSIDTLSSNAIKTLTIEMDKQCKDSSDVLRKRLVDSLVVVREREIMMQTLPTH